MNAVNASNENTVSICVPSVDGDKIKALIGSNISDQRIDYVFLHLDEDFSTKIKKAIVNYKIAFLIVTDDITNLSLKKPDISYICNELAEFPNFQIILYQINSEKFKRSYSDFLTHYFVKENDESNLKTIIQAAILQYQIFLFKRAKIRIEDSFDYDDIKRIEELNEVFNVSVFTAVNVELKAVLTHLNPIKTRSKICRLSFNSDIYYFGRIGQNNVILTMTGPGSHNVILNCQSAFFFFKPKFAILCGIAFGIKEFTHHMGDVLVSDQVFEYEYQKISSNKRSNLRGIKIPPNSALLNYIKSISNWHFKLTDKLESKIRFGPILSGDKIINDREFRDELCEFCPTAIGGEMEAIGLSKAANKYGVNWIVIKSICDWGHGKTDDFQDLAAESSISLIVHFLEEKNLLDFIKSEIN